MTNEQRRDEAGVTITPGEPAKNVGQILARNLFLQNGNPARMSVSEDEAAAIFAIGVQTVIDSIRGMRGVTA